MPPLFEVQATDIEKLDDVQLTQLLKLLLHQEARKAGIVQRAVEVALNIRVADGGEDGRIQWLDGPTDTDFLPTRFIQFQNKATNMGPADCASELVRGGHIKPRIDEALTEGAAYILFTTQLLNQEQKDDRIARMRQILRDHQRPYADSATIEIYDAARIQGWANNYISAITAVLGWVGRPLIIGLQTFEHWERYEENGRLPFVPDALRASARDQIRASLTLPRHSARIIGLSGLGKTRLALEICRDSAAFDGFANDVIYIDANSDGLNLRGIVAGWVQQKLDGKLIIDNCDLRLHQQLRREIQHPDSRLSLLTMHYDPDSERDDETITLLPMSDGFIKSMLEPTYEERIPDLDRVVQFAQGFPQMAYLLVVARLDQARDMGNLNNDVLIHKMLWGDGPKNDADENILRACSLFDKFGLVEEAEYESEFIAANIARRDSDALYECIRRFERRGIVNCVGRFSQIIPKPLAIRLAADWWRTTRKKRQEELIATNMPGQLENSFCDQIAKLDFLPEVKDLTAGLCGNQGPFGQAEVILSDRGSRFFRALVEVNPTATADALYRVLSEMADGAIRAIRGDVRRNFVTSLEKLCFREDTFSKAARLLLRLGANENESWSNNATGLFKQLFRIFLSGTEAPPADRIALLDESLRSDNNATRGLAIEALGVAIDIHGGTRVVGAEYQGSGAPLQEWRPTIWQEAFDYWIAAIQRLSDLAIEDTAEGQKAREALGGSIRGLLSTGQDVVNALDRAIHAIARHRTFMWHEALESISHAKSYDADSLHPMALAKLHEWESLLAPTQLADRIELIVSRPTFEHTKGADGRYIDLAAQKAAALARDLAPNQEALVPLIPSLLQNDQRQGFIFGETLVTTAGTWEPLLSTVLDIAKKEPLSNASLLLGVLSGVYKIRPADWERTIGTFSQTEGLEGYYPYAITSGVVSKHHLTTIIALVEEKRLEESRISILAYGRSLESVSIVDVNEFALQLSKLSPTAGWIALDILAMYCYDNARRFESSIEAFCRILATVSFESDACPKGTSDVYHWTEATKRILSRGDMTEFAITLVRRLFESDLSKIDYHAIRFGIHPVLRLILAKYGDEVWPYIARAVESADPIGEYRLAQILGSTDYFERESGPSVLSELPHALLARWCAAFPDLAPRFVARAIEPFVMEGGRIRLSNRAQFLFDEYGDNDKVLNALSSNMGSFGWSGSLVPHLEREVGAIEPLCQHANSKVRAWANQRIGYLNQAIKDEQTRDSEHSLGIY